MDYPMRVFKNLTALKAAVGTDFGATDYLTVTQEMIDDFARATLDFQWIHTDPDRARQTPFGGTIAHGFLTLSLASKLLGELFTVESTTMGMNYGLNRVRFTGVVPSGGQVRMRATLFSAEDFPNGGLKAEVATTFELAGATKPVCIAEWVILQFE